MFKFCERKGGNSTRIEPEQISFHLLPQQRQECDCLCPVILPAVGIYTATYVKDKCHFLRSPLLLQTRNEIHRLLNCKQTIIVQERCSEEQASVLPRNSRDLGVRKPGHCSCVHHSMGRTHLRGISQICFQMLPRLETKFHCIDRRYCKN